MSYDLHDATGFVAGGPSINGLRTLKAAIEAKHLSAAVYPQLASIFINGYCTSPLRLKYECAALSKIITSKDDKHTLIEIGKAASKSKHIVILHDHIS